MSGHGKKEDTPESHDGRGDAASLSKEIIRKKLENHFIVPSCISKDDSLKVLSVLLGRYFRTREKFIEYSSYVIECQCDGGSEIDNIPSGTIEFLTSYYSVVDHFGEKEASGNVVLIPFLGQAVRILSGVGRSRYLVDPEFVVTRTPRRGRNPCADFAVVDVVSINMWLLYVCQM